MPSSQIWLAIAIAIASCVCAPAPVAAQTTAKNGKIAFILCESDSNGNPQCDIWVMNPDGSGQLNLTNTPDLTEVDPAWSPDGTRIAYVEGAIGFNRLMVMNADGSAQTVVTPEPSMQFGPNLVARRHPTRLRPAGARTDFLRAVGHPDGEPGRN